MRDQQQAADIMIREGEFTSNVLNSPRFTRLVTDKNYQDAAKLIDERYGVNGRTGLDTKIYVDGVQQAVDCCRHDRRQSERPCRSKCACS